MRRFLAILGILMAFGHPLQVDAAVECSDLFSTPAVTDSVADEIPYDRPTVQIAGRVYNENREEFLRLRRIHNADSWRSTYAPRGFDTQGDPTWVFHSLGPILAEVLGFKRVEDFEIWAPTPETFNQRVAAFNTYLNSRSIEPIRFQLYWQDKPLVRSFLSRWRNLEAPLAADLSAHTVHDISYHLTGVFLTRGLLDLIRGYAELAEQWFEYYPTGIGPSFTREVASWVDSASTVANQTGNQPFRAESVYLPLIHLTSYGITKVDAEPKTAKTPLAIFMARLRYHYTYQTVVHRQPVDQNFEKTALRFEQEMKDQAFRLWNRNLEDLEVASAAGVAKNLNTRVAELRAAAEDYLRLKKRK